MIESRFAKVAEWARSHGIDPRRIFVGEFGAIRRRPGTPGARCEDRMRWLRDMRVAAEKSGFSWAYFNYDGNYDGAFSITLSETNRTLDPDVLASLGMTKRKKVC